LEKRFQNKEMIVERTQNAVRNHPIINHVLLDTTSTTSLVTAKGWEASFPSAIGSFMRFSIPMHETFNLPPYVCNLGEGNHL
jgi:hypothetical protein